MERPQRQRPTAVRPPKPKGLPWGSTSSKSPSIRRFPLLFTVIFVPAIYAPEICRNSTIKLQSLHELILRHGRIHFVGPGENPALEIKYLTEARLAQKIDGLGGALSTAAVRHDFPGRVELMDA